MNKQSLIMLLIMNSGTSMIHAQEIEIVLQVSSITTNQLTKLREELGAQLKKLQTGLQAWFWTPQMAFNLTAKNIYDCSDLDIAIFPFAQGMHYVTIEEFNNLLCVDRLNKLWESIRSSVKDIHDVRYQTHLIVCKDFSITNEKCGDAGYKQIEKSIKNNKEYETRYKQHVTDGLAVSYLYEIGVLR